MPSEPSGSNREVAAVQNEHVLVRMWHRIARPGTLVGFVISAIGALLLLSNTFDEWVSLIGKMKSMGPVLKSIAEILSAPTAPSVAIIFGFLWVGAAAWIGTRPRAPLPVKQEDISSALLQEVTLIRKALVAQSKSENEIDAFADTLDLLADDINSFDEDDRLSDEKLLQTQPPRSPVISQEDIPSQMKLHEEMSRQIEERNAMRDMAFTPLSHRIVALIDKLAAQGMPPKFCEKLFTLAKIGRRPTSHDMQRLVRMFKAIASELRNPSGRVS